MYAEKVSCTGKNHWFIKHHPVRYPVSKIFHTTRNVFFKPANNIPVYPSTFFLKRIGKIPMIKGNPRHYIQLQAKIDNTVIKINTSMVHASCSFRQYAA